MGELVVPLYPPTEENDGRCRCGRLAIDFGENVRCEWHPAVRVRRLQRLYAADRALPVGDELEAPLVEELRMLSESIEGVPANYVDVGEVSPGRLSDPVDHPPHYTGHPSGVECIDVVEHMSFLRGNAVKYLWRAGAKGDELEDLRKARWYLDREIANLERERAHG